MRPGRGRSRRTGPGRAPGSVAPANSASSTGTCRAVARMYIRSPGCGLPAFCRRTACPSRRISTGRAQRGNTLAMGDGAGRMHRVADQFVVLPAGQFQLDPLNRAHARRHGQLQPSRHRTDRPPLQHQRGEHDQEGDVEDLLRVGQAGDQRQDREQDGDRAAQAHPGDEGDLAAGEAERQQAEPDGKGPCQEDQHGGERKALKGEAAELRRRRQQSQRHEHADLPEPGHAALEVLQRGCWRMRTLPQTMPAT